MANIKRGSTATATPPATAQRSGGTSDPGFRFDVKPSTVPFTERKVGREAQPNPLLDAVKHAETKRAEAFDVSVADEAASKRAINLLRRAGNELNVSLRIEYFPTAKIVKFAVKPGEKIVRPRKSTEAASNGAT
jgi:hypothetical protein